MAKQGMSRPEPPLVQPKGDRNKKTKKNEQRPVPEIQDSK